MVMFFSRSFIQYKSKKYYVLLLVPFLFSYYLCSLIIFDSKSPSMEFNSKTTDSSKAVIFYCSGQMEEYSPQDAGNLLKSENTLLKPLYARKLKAIYKKIDFSQQNDSVLQVAMELKNSLLRNYPYYFYIAYSDYYPNLYTAIQASIHDGCGNIQILNYSSKKLALSQEFAMQLKKHKISVEITPCVYSATNFPIAITRIIEASTQKQDGILLLSNATHANNAEKISSLLVSKGYLKENIIVSPKATANLDAAFQSFSNKKVKNMFYVNLENDNFDYTTKLLLDDLSKKYSGVLKTSGSNNWGYNKFLVRAAIEVLRNKQ